MGSLVGVVEVLVGGLDLLAAEINIVEGVQLLPIADVDLLDELEGVAELVETGGVGEGLEVGIGWHGIWPFQKGSVGRIGAEGLGGLEGEGEGVGDGFIGDLAFEGV